MKNKKSIILVIGACLLAAIMFLVSYVNRPTVQKGAKNVIVEVVDPDNNTKTYKAKTDAEYLIDLMDELKESTDFTYEGSTSDYGMYITSINNVEAIFDVNNAYWAIYVNEEYGQYGVDQQPVADNDTFRFAYEVSN